MALSKIDAANFLTGTIPSGNIATSSLAAAATGKVLQVVTATITNTFGSTSGSFTDITGLTVDITPSATSSKIFISSTIQASGNTLDRVFGFQLVRGSTAIAIGGADGNRTRATASGSMVGSDSTNEQKNFAINFIDSPSSTSQQTYKIQGKGQGTGDVFAVNRSGNDSNHDYQFRNSSTITVMEIAG